MAYMCEHDGALAVDAAEMRLHNREDHSSWRHECQTCFSTFSTVRVLNNHRFVRHDFVEEGPRFFCVHCNTGTFFSSANALHAHSRTHSVYSSQNKCCDCQNIFAVCNELKNHIAECSDKLDYLHGLLHV